MAWDASNQPTSGLDRHQSTKTLVSPSMAAHIRDGRYHPQGAICSAFHFKVPLPSLCSLVAHLRDFLMGRGCSWIVTFCGFGVGGDIFVLFMLPWRIISSLHTNLHQYTTYSRDDCFTPWQFYQNSTMYLWTWLKLYFYLSYKETGTSYKETGTKIATFFFFFFTL